MLEVAGAEPQPTTTLTRLLNYMGTWGTAIFSDDLAADTRDAFTDSVADGLSASEATERLVRESSELLEDEDDARVFWIALAAAQWKLGRLVGEVRDRAVEIIDTRKELSRWQENTTAEINQRKKHLAKLREQLLSPQPKLKKIKPRVRSSTDLRVGDIAEFQFEDDLSARLLPFFSASCRTAQVVQQHDA